jgi:hypothetical protein
MHNQNVHIFEYRIKSDELEESSFDWGKILGLLCGEICIVLLSKELQDKYIEDEEYRVKVINFIRAKTSFRRYEKVYSLCISLDKEDIQNI